MPLETVEARPKAGPAAFDWLVGSGRDHACERWQLLTCRPRTATRNVEAEPGIGDKSDAIDAQDRVTEEVTLDADLVSEASPR